MLTTATINRFLMGNFSFGEFTQLQKNIGSVEFYQLLASELIKHAGRGRFLHGLGDRLAELAEQAHALRRMDALDQLSEALINLPLPRRYQMIGRYYQALCINNFGQGDLNKAQAVQECMTVEAPLRYRVKATQLLAVIYKHRGDLQTSLSLYSESGRMVSGKDIYGSHFLVSAHKMIAAIHGLEGDRQAAVNMLENLFPLAHSIRSIHPHVYYDYLNSLAVEYMEAGRLEEARNASQIVTRSPFAFAYPEWRETRDEIAVKERRASRSTMKVPSSYEREEEPPLPEIERSNVFDLLSSLTRRSSDADSLPSEPDEGPGRVLNFNRRTDRTDKRSLDASKGEIKSSQLEKMSLPEIKAWNLLKLLQEGISATSMKRISEVIRTAILKEEGEAALRPRVIDLETPGQLELLIRLWVNEEASPEELAGVMSALVSCKDNLRRTNIIDRMVSYAFNESRKRIEAEEEWRKELEEEVEQVEMRGLETLDYLGRIIRIWVNGEATPEELAKLLLILRNCEDELEQSNIMDGIISCAFNESRERMEVEDEWRKRVMAELAPDAVGE